MYARFQINFNHNRIQYQTTNAVTTIITQFIGFKTVYVPFIEIVTIIYSIMTYSEINRYLLFKSLHHDF